MRYLVCAIVCAVLVSCEVDRDQELLPIASESENESESEPIIDTPATGEAPIVPDVSAEIPNDASTDTPSIDDIPPNNHSPQEDPSEPTSIEDETADESDVHQMNAMHQIAQIAWRSVGPGGGGPALSLALVPSGNTETVLAGTDVGGVYRSYLDTSGAWQWDSSNEGLLDNNFQESTGLQAYDVNGITVSPDHSTLYLATSAGVFYSASGSEAFFPLLTVDEANPCLDPTTGDPCNYRSSVVTVHPDDPQRLYVGTGETIDATFGTSSYWYSENGGSSWTSVTITTLKGKKAVIYSLILDPDLDMLYIATSKGIYRTQNHRDFEAVNDGLPSSLKTRRMVHNPFTHSLFVLVDIEAPEAAADYINDSKWRGGLYRATTGKSIQWENVSGTLPKWVYTSSGTYSVYNYRGLALSPSPDRDLVYVGSFRSGHKHGAGVWRYASDAPVWQLIGYMGNSESYWINNRWGKSAYAIAVAEDGNRLYSSADEIMMLPDLAALLGHLNPFTDNLLASTNHSFKDYSFEGSQSSIIPLHWEALGCKSSDTPTSDKADYSYCGITAEKGRSGKQSVKIAARFSSDRPVSRIGLRSEPMSVVPGKRYWVGVYARVANAAESSNEQPAAVRVLFYDAQGKESIGGFEAEYALKTPWLFLSLGSKAPAGARTMRLELSSMNRNSVVYFDDVKIAERDSDSPYDWRQLASSLIENNGDETENTWLGTFNDTFAYDLVPLLDKPNEFYVAFDDIRLWNMHRDPMGGVSFRSPVLDDEWRTWNNGESSPIHADAVTDLMLDPNKDRLYLGVSDGMNAYCGSAVLYTDDHSDTFHSLSLPSQGGGVRLARSPSTLYASIYRKGIFASKDGGPFAAIHTHAVDPARKLVTACTADQNCDGVKESGCSDTMQYLVSRMAYDPANDFLYVGFESDAYTYAEDIEVSETGTLSQPLSGGLWRYDPYNPNTPWTQITATMPIELYAYNSENGAGAFLGVQNVNVLNHISFIELVEEKTGTALYVGTLSRGRPLDSEGKVQEGGLYRSRDGGQSWETLFKATALGALAIHPKDSKLMIVSSMQQFGPPRGQGVTGIYVSSDGGKTWNPATDWNRYNTGLGHSFIHQLLFHPQSTTYLYGLTRGGGIYEGEITYR